SLRARPAASSAALLMRYPLDRRLKLLLNARCARGRLCCASSEATLVWTTIGIWVSVLSARRSRADRAKRPSHEPCQPQATGQSNKRFAAQTGCRGNRDDLEHRSASKAECFPRHRGSRLANGSEL